MATHQDMFIFERRHLACDEGDMFRRKKSVCRELKVMAEIM